MQVDFDVDVQRALYALPPTSHMTPIKGALGREGTPHQGGSKASKTLKDGKKSARRLRPRDARREGHTPAAVTAGSNGWV